MTSTASAIKERPPHISHEYPGEMYPDFVPHLTVNDSSNYIIIYTQDLTSIIRGFCHPQLKDEANVLIVWSRRSTTWLVVVHLQGPEIYSTLAISKQIKESSVQSSSLTISTWPYISWTSITDLLKLHSTQELKLVPLLTSCCLRGLQASRSPDLCCGRPFIFPMAPTHKINSKLVNASDRFTLTCTTFLHI